VAPGVSIELVPPQFDPLRVEILEEPDAAAEEHRDDVELHLVEHPGLQELPHDVRAAPDADVLVAGGARASSSAASIPSVTNV
jgi:hypothetical protein